MIQHATTEGTTRFKERYRGIVDQNHFRNSNGFWFSSIGFGSYLGNYDDTTDINYQRSLIRAVELGCNVFDTAINYRCQRSERAIGTAISKLLEEGKIQRDEVIFATKGGYIPFDSTPPRDFREYIAETFIKTGVIKPEDIVGGIHCMAPSYIENQLEQSIKNLRVRCIDIYYLHNPEEQLQEISPKEFNRRMESAFELLEKKVSEGKIKLYGMATWSGYREEPGSKEYMSLEDAVRIAKRVAGDKHNFKVIQLPFNLAMPEAFLFKNQFVKGKWVSPLEAAKDLGITVITSSPLLQGRLSRDLPEFITEHLRGLNTDAQRAIQFARSIPGITTTLVGMSSTEHVEENMQVARLPTIPVDNLLKIFLDE